MVKFNEWKPGDPPITSQDQDWVNSEVLLVSAATFLLGVIVGWIWL